MTNSRRSQSEKQCASRGRETTNLHLRRGPQELDHKGLHLPLLLHAAKLQRELTGHGALHERGHIPDAHALHGGAVHAEEHVAGARAVRQLPTAQEGREADASLLVLRPAPVEPRQPELGLRGRGARRRGGGVVLNVGVSN